MEILPIQITESTSPIAWFYPRVHRFGFRYRVHVTYVSLCFEFWFGISSKITTEDTVTTPRIQPSNHAVYCGELIHTIVTLRGSHQNTVLRRLRKLECGHPDTQEDIRN